MLGTLAPAWPEGRVCRDTVGAVGTVRRIVRSDSGFCGSSETIFRNRGLQEAEDSGVDPTSSLHTFRALSHLCHIWRFALIARRALGCPTRRRAARLGGLDGCNWECGWAVKSLSQAQVRMRCADALDAMADTAVPVLPALDRMLQGMGLQPSEWRRGAREQLQVGLLARCRSTGGAGATWHKVRLVRARICCCHPRPGLRLHLDALLRW